MIKYAKKKLYTKTNGKYGNNGYKANKVQGEYIVAHSK